MNKTLIADYKGVRLTSPLQDQGVFSLYMQLSQIEKNYGRNMNGVDNYSLMEEDELLLKLENALKYFEYIASLNYWDHIPGGLLI